MEELIRQAFVHVEIIGPHVAEGHYDLVGPNGKIILPQIWETMIEPDWAITMHMWPVPEPPSGLPDGMTIVDPAFPCNRPARRRGPPKPPLRWIEPLRGRKDVNEIIVIEDNGTIKSAKKKARMGGGVLGGLFVGDNDSIKSAKEKTKTRGRILGLFNGKRWKKYA
jgi:hypothetical protein